MRRLAWALCVLSLGMPLLAQSQRPGRGRANQAPLRPEDIAVGRDIYNRNCTACHGIDGAAGDRAPALGATRRYLRQTSSELFDAIKNGIPGTLMPPSPLPADEVRRIVNYILSLRATASQAPLPGDPENGARVFFSDAGCAACHSIHGRGGILGPDLSNIGGERRVEALRDALTKPRPSIPRGYVPVRIVFKNGAALEGIVKNEHNSSLQILGKDGRLHSVDRDEAASIHYAAESMMPSDWDRRLNRTDFQDLLAFLSRQTRGSR